VPVRPPLTMMRMCLPAGCAWPSMLSVWSSFHFGIWLGEQFIVMLRTESGSAGECFDLVFSDHLFDHGGDCLATFLVLLDEWISDAHDHLVDECDGEWSIVDATAEWRELLEDWNVAVVDEHNLATCSNECLANIEVEVCDLLLGKCLVVGKVEVCSGDCV